MSVLSFFFPGYTFAGIYVEDHRMANDIYLDLCDLFPTLAFFNLAYTDDGAYITIEPQLNISKEDLYYKILERVTNREIYLKKHMSFSYRKFYNDGRVTYPGAESVQKNPEEEIENILEKNLALITSYDEV